jgi:hypothetical protein
MMRRLSFVLGSLLLVLALAAPASAATVDRYPLTFDFIFVDFGCGFEVDATVTINKEFETDFYDNDGNLVRSVVTGHQVGTFVNPANGKSIVENTSSSAHYDYVHDKFVLTGRSAVFSMIINGRLDLTDFTLHGTVRNEICPALA